MEENTDFLNDIPIETSKSDLTQLALLCKKLKSQRTIVDNLEAELEEAKKKERVLSQNEIPEFLKTKGVKALSLDDGTNVSIKDSVKTSLPKKDPIKRTAVLKWVIKQGGSNIIKRALIIEEPTKGTIDLLKENNIIFKDSKDIHHSTFRAWVSAKLGMSKNTIQEIELDDIPNELNIFIYQETILK